MNSLQSVVVALALACTSAFSSQRAGVRQQTALRMSIAVGEQFPAPALSKIGVSGKPAVLYFYGAAQRCIQHFWSTARKRGPTSNSHRRGRSAVLHEAGRGLRRGIERVRRRHGRGHPQRQGRQGRLRGQVRAAVLRRRRASAASHSHAIDATIGRLTSRAQDDEIRNEIGIPKDLFVLGGRETYVVDKDGTVVICA